MIDEQLFYNKKVLIGDYDNTSFKYTNMILSKLGLIVSNSSTTDDIKTRILNGEKYDVIITNNVYKHGSGEELVRDLKEIEGFNTPVIIHSISEKSEFNGSDFDGYLQKPINKEDVIELFNKILK